LTHERGERRASAPADEQAISNLAHELRTPLAVIIGYAELLRLRDDEETRKEAPERIVTAAQELGWVVDDLLTVFAIEAGALLIDAQPIELETAVTQVVEEFRQRSGSYLFATSTEGPWPVVAADQQHLSRILTSLFMNACKASADGGEVRIAIRREDDFAVVEVSDDGIGLTKKQLAVVFDRFAVDLPEQLGVRRSGLELYKVRRLVELQGGSISATSEPGKGASFTFTLPLATLDEAA